MSKEAEPESTDESKIDSKAEEGEDTATTMIVTAAAKGNSMKMYFFSVGLHSFRTQQKRKLC